ncbi:MULTISPECIES: aldo/keto reductase [unclassified Devosia]|uniref:aldo/keto reductase n=1 Tax=unclassified Devosia TaxID=196773 RepID=UPI00145EB334|nr:MULTISPECIES: aldo/keto reductase [unclassified Devosia]MBJ6988923.1 aldo/keto reductase [Devosia sp. MC521]QMW62271.1 aldo/keto reductase [Devosia sp. MC521]
MRLKQLGHTDITVTDICLGTMTWGSQNTEAEGHAQIAMAKDAGITFMDTAEMYAVPASPATSFKTEEIIGNWFAQNGDREHWVLASKIGGPGHRHIRDGSAPSSISFAQALEGSLERLQTDYLDLYQIHWPSRPHYHFENYWKFAPEKHDPKQTLDHMADVLGAINAALAAGKIRSWGLSNESAWGLTKWAQLADQMGVDRPVTVQNEYNLLRRNYDHDLAEVTHHENIGLLAYSPLAAGVLTGKYFDGATPKGSRKEYQKGLWRLNDYSEAATKRYHALAQQHGLDPVAMAIAFCTTRPFATSTIIGATSTEQLAQCLSAKDLVLSPEVLADIETIHRDMPRPI